MNRIEVGGLWKVFGSKPERVFEEAYASKSRAEIQEELGNVVALRDVTFDVEVGQIFVVMGLSGSGKSTLVRCLTRLMEPTAGQVRFDGEDILAYTPEQLLQFRRATRLAMVFQHYALLPHRRVLDNVAYGLEVRGVEKAGTVRGCGPRSSRPWASKDGRTTYPREMSGGMQQRVGLG